MPGYRVQWHDILPSTNTYLRELLSKNPALASGTVVAARCQTAGRGRYQRTWVTSPGRDLAFSLLHRAEVPASWMPSLAMAGALAVAQMLAKFKLQARVKWPNDVYIGRRKICGILSECVPPRTRVPYQESMVHTAIIGIGLNVNMTADETKVIKTPATSIRIETGKMKPVEAVLDALLAVLPAWITRWQESGFAALRDDWIRLTEGIGKNVTIGDGRKRRTGILTGFGPNGELLLRDATGKNQVILLGDIVS